MESYIRLVCPGCRKILTINAAPNIADKFLVCPNCKHRDKVKDYPLYKPSPQPATPPPPPGEAWDKPTDIVQDFDKPTDVMLDGGPGTPPPPPPPVGASGFVLTAGGERLNLPVGVSTFGRRALSSTASIQVPDPSNLMSRRQGVFYVSPGCCRYEQLQTKNPTIFRGHRLFPGDVVELAVGDTLTVGNTQVTLQHAAQAGGTVYSEETQIL